MNKGLDGKRTISSEQRWGVALEPTILSGWNEETQTVELGETLEDLREQQAEKSEKKILERIENEILRTLDGQKLNQGDLLSKVKGKNLTKWQVLRDLVREGRVQTETSGKEILYSYTFLTKEFDLSSGIIGLQLEAPVEF